MLVCLFQCQHNNLGIQVLLGFSLIIIANDQIYCSHIKELFLNQSELAKAKLILIMP